jgi:beta-xylosidase
MAHNPKIKKFGDKYYLYDIPSQSGPTRGHTRDSQCTGVAVSASLTGPFLIQPQQPIKDYNTEDAEMWWDARREKFFAIFHAYEYIGLIESSDGLRWQPAQHHKMIEGNRLKRTDGTWLHADPIPLQRPSVFCEDGGPRVVCLCMYRIKCSS